MLKPILRTEYEHLYADNNMDFSDKYDLRSSVYLLELTYADGYVYGYAAGEEPETAPQAAAKR